MSERRVLVDELRRDVKSLSDALAEERLRLDYYRSVLTDGGSVRIPTDLLTERVDARRVTDLADRERAIRSELGIGPEADLLAAVREVVAGRDTFLAQGKDAVRQRDEAIARAEAAERRAVEAERREHDRKDRAALAISYLRGVADLRVDCCMVNDAAEDAANTIRARDAEIARLRREIDLRDTQVRALTEEANASGTEAARLRSRCERSSKEWPRDAIRQYWEQDEQIKALRARCEALERENADQYNRLIAAREAESESGGKCSECGSKEPSCEHRIDLMVALKRGLDESESGQEPETDPAEDSDPYRHEMPNGCGGMLDVSADTDAEKLALIRKLVESDPDAAVVIGCAFKLWDAADPAPDEPRFKRGDEVEVRTSVPGMVPSDAETWLPARVHEYGENGALLAIGDCPDGQWNFSAFPEDIRPVGGDDGE